MIVRICESLYITNELHFHQLFHLPRHDHQHVLQAPEQPPTLVSPIIDRHQKAAMYHPFAEEYVFPHIFYYIAHINTRLALALVDLPLTFVTSLIFGIFIYFNSCESLSLWRHVFLNQFLIF